MIKTGISVLKSGGGYVILFRVQTPRFPEKTIKNQ